MANFIYAELTENENTQVLINVERANYIVFNEDEETAIFWFGAKDAYSIPGKKEEIMNLIQGMGINVFKRP